MLTQNTKTLIIPTYTLNDELEHMTLQCIASHKNQVTQIIVSEDGGRYSDKIRERADVYLYKHYNVGFTKNVNQAWNLSDADFTIIANSDTFLVSGNLEDLCRINPAKVCSPKIENLPVQNNGFNGSYFVVPKKIKDKYGVLDERFKNFQSDIEYYYRIKHLFQRDTRVVIHHNKSRTLRASNLDLKAELDRDALVYNQVKNNEI